jgi:uncharacterized protein YebE (UPF0316 family)
MAREQLPYFDPATQGNGVEGFLNWANISMDYALITLFLGVFYTLAIYLATKNEYKMGGQITYISLLFFILAMIAQTFTEFNQIVIFIFAIGFGLGIVMSFIENAK